jgi:Uncharacterized conserved protein (DUF2285)
MRTYKPKQKPRRGRMIRAVDMRAQGMSLREIARAVGVKSPNTIARDLARWDAEAAKITRLSHRPVPKVTPGGEKWDSGMGQRQQCDPVPEASDSDSNVIPFRRQA